MSEYRYPLVTVGVPVHNGDKYLSVALDAILSQTFKDFELLVLNDGSSDDSLQIVKGIHDDRIKIVSHDTSVRSVFDAFNIKYITIFNFY
jgi:glycosyltransferase involved in cell wall biosynthesis